MPGGFWNDRLILRRTKDGNEEKMKVGIMGNCARLKDASVIGRLADFLKARGYETAVFEKNEDIDGAEVLVVLGGDGAILHVASAAARKNIAVIGINYGTLGFLAEYEKEETERVVELLEEFRTGRCGILERSLLGLSFGGKTYYALNEIAFLRDYTAAQVVGLEVFRNGKESCKVVGDGALLCTPTGSTAYSLSAGGAILAPETPVFMLTPVCSFSFNPRPMIFPDADTFLVRVTKGKVLLLADGKQAAALEEGMTAEVAKAPFAAKFPIRKESLFLKKIRTKLNQ